MNPAILTIYCERGFESGLFSEPVNAVTNLLFIAFGFLGYRFFKRSNLTDGRVLSLPFIFASIGVGSLLFHTWRNTTTVIFDAIPIYIFILFALFLLLGKLTTHLRSSLLIALFVVLEVVISAYLPKDILNGSIRHLVAWMFIIIVAYFTHRRYGEIVRRPLAMLLIFYATGIFFRSMDMAFCQAFPLGTHFLWHIFTALAGYQAMFLLGVIDKHTVR